MDLQKYKAQNSEKAVLKLRDKDPVTDSKIDGWSTVHGTLSDGNECFISLPDVELEKVPEQNGYIDLTGLAILKKNKIGKMYLERLVEMPARNTVFDNPFAKK